MTMGEEEEVQVEVKVKVQTEVQTEHTTTLIRYDNPLDFLSKRDSNRPTEEEEQVILCVDNLGVCHSAGHTWEQVMGGGGNESSLVMGDAIDPASLDAQSYVFVERPMSPQQEEVH